MAEVIVKVEDQNGNPVSGADVQLNWKNWLGGEEESKGTTGIDGIVKQSIGVAQTTIEIRASKGFSVAKTSVFVNLLGTTEPANPQVLQLVFKPLDAPADFVTDLGRSLDRNAKYLLLAVGIPFGMITAYLLYRYVTTGKFIGTVKSVAGAAAGKIPGAKK